MLFYKLPKTIGGGLIKSLILNWSLTVNRKKKKSIRILNIKQQFSQGLGAKMSVICPVDSKTTKCPSP